MGRGRREGQSQPMTLGQALAAQVRLIVWCKACGHQAEPDIAKQLARYGESTSVIDWAGRLRCSDCHGREIDFVVSGVARWCVRRSPKRGSPGSFGSHGAGLTFTARIRVSFLRDRGRRDRS